MDKVFTPKTVYVTYIVTTPQKLWAALTRPELSRQYFFWAKRGVEVEGRLKLRQTA